MNRLAGYIFMFIIIPAGMRAADDSFIDKLEYIRVSYYESVENENVVEKVERYISVNFPDGKNCPAVITAYRAAIQSVKSKHAFWPVTKLEYFNESMELFEKAVKSDPNNLEIRFLRFTILHYVPSFLGHGSERNADMLVILKKLGEKDYSMIKAGIQKGITEFLIRSGRLTAKQEKYLYSLYPDAHP
jgi:hypothetical protein